MVSGHLRLKSGYWYIILSLRQENGKRGPKWFSTGLKEKGNKRRAEERLIELRQHYTALELVYADASRLYWVDYLKSWLESRRSTVAPSTFETYYNIIYHKITPFFGQYKLLLHALRPRHFNHYYQHLQESGLSPNTMLRHHAILHKALRDAVCREFIALNPADSVQRPRKESYITTPYSSEEMGHLLRAIQGHPMELPIKLAAFYGLRRSEVLGLKWKAINFDTGTLTINHTYQRIHVDQMPQNIALDKVKRKSSYRTFPMPNHILEFISSHQKKEKWIELFPPKIIYA